MPAPQVARCSRYVGVIGTCALPRYPAAQRAVKPDGYRIWTLVVALFSPCSASTTVAVTT